MEIREKMVDGYLLSNDKSRLQPEVVYQYLSQESYWAQGRTLDAVQISISNSECFGIYWKDQQVGFARWIMDKAVFAYLADVFVLPTHQGKGLAKNLMEFMLSFEEIKESEVLFLGTRDAHGLYAQYGFQPIPFPDRYMIIRKKAKS